MIQIDIQMPKCCYDCNFYCDDGDYPYCMALMDSEDDYSFNVEAERFPNCPIKEVDDSQYEKEMLKRRNMCKALFNRCRAFGSANRTMCKFCNMAEDCEAEHTV